MALITNLVTAILCRIFGEEIVVWIPRLCCSLINFAVRRLPVEQRARYGEEWRSYVNEVPGTISKIVSAAGFLLASSKVRISAFVSHETTLWLQAVVQLEECLSKATVIVSLIRDDELLVSHEGLRVAVNRLDYFLNDEADLADLRIHVADLDARFQASPLVGLVCRLRNRQKMEEISRGFNTMVAKAKTIQELNYEVMKTLAARTNL